MATTTRVNRNIPFHDPPFIVSLFNDTRWSWLWLIMRLYLGYSWLSSGLGKLSNPGWTQTGQALAGYWTNAVRIPDAPARPLIAFEWYRSFLQFMLDQQWYTWFSKIIMAGEILIGTALILGAFVGIASFFGAFMNWNFMMAGTAGVNPLMFLFTIFLILAWKTAGWIGLDRWLLRSLGTPWQPGETFRARESTRTEALPITGVYRPDPDRPDVDDDDDDLDRQNDINAGV